METSPDVVEATEKFIKHLFYEYPIDVMLLTQLSSSGSIYDDDTDVQE
jgi:hypothetical protein